MTEQPTSQLATAATMRGEWSRFAAFLRCPALPTRAAPMSGVSMAAVLRLALLDLAVAGALILLATGAAMAGLTPPDHALDEIAWTPEIVLTIVLLAPLLEELAFRGWLSGRPGAVLPLVLLGTALATVLLARGGDMLAATGFAAILAILAAALAIMFYKRGAWIWFARIFPLMFWLSTASFALIHLLNYSEGSLVMLLPLVLPQFIAGAIFGYARVTYGLWASILLHVLHNGALVSGVILALRYAG